MDLLAVQGTLKSLQHHSSKASILRHSAFSMVQLSHPYMTTGKCIKYLNICESVILKKKKKGRAKPWTYHEVTGRCKYPLCLFNLYPLSVLLGNYSFNQSYLFRVQFHPVCGRLLGFPPNHFSVGKESACNAGDPSSIPGLGRSPGEEKGYPLQCSGLENSMDCMGLQRVGHNRAIFTFPFTLALEQRVIQLETIFPSLLGSLTCCD